MNQTAKKLRRLTLNDILAVTLIWAAVIYGLSTGGSLERTHARAAPASCG
ncbi:hypothetical protein [Caulobacter sp. NIBR2454]|nr:hypothetical protein [Caulobacter sp. NIBR2454]